MFKLDFTVFLSVQGMEPRQSQSLHRRKTSYKRSKVVTAAAFALAAVVFAKAR